MKNNNKMTTHVYYEVWATTSGWTYPTYKEAVNQLADMNNGFPNNIHMSKESREYWKKVASHYFIYKVSTVKEKIV